MISNNDYAFLSITITHTHTWGDVIVRGGEVNVVKSRGSRWRARLMTMIILKFENILWAPSLTHFFLFFCVLDFVF